MVNNLVSRVSFSVLLPSQYQTKLILSASCHNSHEFYNLYHLVDCGKITRGQNCSSYLYASAFCLQKNTTFMTVNYVFSPLTSEKSHFLSPAVLLYQVTSPKKEDSSNSSINICCMGFIPVNFYTDNEQADLYYCFIAIRSVF